MVSIIARRDHIPRHLRRIGRPHHFYRGSMLIPEGMPSKASFRHPLCRYSSRPNRSNSWNSCPRVLPHHLQLSLACLCIARLHPCHMLHHSHTAEEPIEGGIRHKAGAQDLRSHRRWLCSENLPRLSPPVPSWSTRGRRVRRL